MSVARGHLAARLLRSERARRQVAVAGELLAFFEWQRETFGVTDVLPTRVELWSRISDELATGGKEWHGLEFGVAYGHASRWWLRRHDTSVLTTWDGFDRFTGLPREWRRQGAGTYSAGEQTPRISDDRVFWHAGDVESTLPEVPDTRIAPGQRLVLFDLDLFEPSKVVWEWLRPRLHPGDILYFDEAFDDDELRLLKECVLPSGEFSHIGGTPLQVALRVTSLRPRD